jgi:hypothetical protein
MPAGRLAEGLPRVTGAVLGARAAIEARRKRPRSFVGIKKCLALICFFGPGYSLCVTVREASLEGKD